jgi:osmotically-inducible protein OsmY
VGLPADRIGIKVERGVITLSGEVPWQFQKTEAEEIVKKLSGITGVVNEIRIGSPVEPVAVKESIEKALERNAELEASRIRVASEGGTVTLHGTVRSWYERDIAERAAWAAAGVKEVRNRISIEP